MDLICPKIAGFDYKEIRTLYLAEQKGLLTPAHHRFVGALDFENIRKSFRPPRPGPLAAFIHSPKRQKHFLKIRNTKLFSYLASTGWFGQLLFLTGLRQDVFLQDEMSCKGLSLTEEECDQCNICQDVCPLGLDLPRYLKKMDEKCIRCMYCYSVCPKRAIKFNGEEGFFREQVRRYDNIIRTLYR
jgi:ferredoxin